MDGEDELYGTVQKMLDEIVGESNNKKTLRDVAADPRFTLRRLLPKPFRLGAETVCMSEGWHPESFVACMDNNNAFLEEPGTALLAIDAGDESSAAEAAISAMTFVCDVQLPAEADPPQQKGTELL